MSPGNPPEQNAGRRNEPTTLTSDDRLRALAQNLHDYAIFLLDAAGCVAEWTDGAQRVMGYTAEEVMGKHAAMFYPPELVAAGDVDKELAEAAANGRAEREQWRLRKGDQRLWVNEVTTAICDESGKLARFAKMSRDLTAQKRAMDALRENEERFRMMVENVRDHAVFTLGPQGNVQTWNTGAQRIFGYSAAEIVGRNASVIFTPQDLAAGEPEKELATAREHGRASDDRWQVRKDGSRFWANGVTSAMRDDAGHLRGFTKVLRDGTEAKLLVERQKRLLGEEQAARKAAERAMLMRDEFVAVVSHELRTPLSAILLWARLAEHPEMSEPERLAAVSTIRQSAEAQRQIIDDLLDVSRMLSGKMRLVVRNVDVAAVIQAAIETVLPTAIAKGVAIEPVLDPRAGRATVDPDRLQQIVWNLLSNAVKFTDAGGRVTVSLQRERRKLIIQVSDTGEGISADFLPHVFDRFSQADASTTRVHGGLGLGLAITRQLVEMHAGTATARSKGLGKGSTFTVSLPLPRQS